MAEATESSEKPILGYYAMRGHGSNIKYQLAYCGVEYDMKYYQFAGEAQNIQVDGWAGDKEQLGLDFPSLPYFIDGEVKLTEPLAIHQYIAAKWKPELLGAEDAAARAK